MNSAIYLYYFGMVFIQHHIGEKHHIAVHGKGLYKY